MALLVDDVLLDAVEGGVLGPVPCDSGSVPWACRRALLGLGELANGAGDIGGGGGGDGSDVRVVAIVLGVDGGGGALLDIVGSDVGLSSTLGCELLGSQVAGVKVADTSNTLGPGSGFGTAEQERALDDFPAFQLPVFLDDLAVQEGDEESGDDDGHTTTDSECDTNGLLVSELDLS